jgi:hypothetical protein
MSWRALRLSLNFGRMMLIYGQQVEIRGFLVFRQGRFIILCRVVSIRSQMCL